MSPQDLCLERLQGQLIPLAVTLFCLGLGRGVQAQAETLTTTFATTTVPEFSYFIGPWSDCSSLCSIGTRERQVYCVRTCSVYYCPKAGETQCPYWDRPDDVEPCYGPLIPCQETTTNTVTRTTITISTSISSTTSPPSTTEPPPVLEGFECAPPGDTQNCLPAAYADLRCRSGCTCCRAEIPPTTEASDIPSTTVAPAEDAEAKRESGAEVSPDIIIAVSTSAAVVASVLCLAWWRSCNRRAEKARSLKKSEQSDISVKVEMPDSPKSTFSDGDKKKRKKDKKKSKEETIFDRDLGRGVPSAPPGGWYDEPPEWMQEETPVSSPKASPSASPSSRKVLFGANGEYHWSPADQPAASSPSGHRRASEPGFSERGPEEAEDSDEVLTPPGSPQNKFQAGAGTIPAGFASATRASRRGGKDPSKRPDPFSAFSSEPPPMPGQANTEHKSPKGPSRRGMATPPRANEDGGAGGERRQSTGADFKRSKTDDAGDGKERPTSAGAKGTKSSDSRQGESSSKPSGDESHEKKDPRVAHETAADSAATDLIAKVDLELDQAQSKDLETRRRVFKNLMLKWHPDKNQEEAMATEVFRHIMSRRGAFLEA
mmetsp:Transcript_89260/g.158302  ORF Transcript_89260/g.158302 Transcript_89260/m.158302 type:complete len:601 (+) Transcript_89260:56-1858(+)